VLAPVVAGLALAACSSSSPAAPRNVATTAPGPPHSAQSRTTSGLGMTIPWAAAATAAEQPGWTVVNRLLWGIAVDSHRSQQSDGDSVTVLRFHAGLVHYALHAGYSDPPTGGAGLPADAQPTIGAREHSQLLAAFNGGFKMGAGCLPCGVGGMEVD